MKIKANLNTLLFLGTAGFIYWKWRQAGLGQGVSDEMMGYVGEQVRPPIWNDWFGSHGDSWDVNPFSDEQAARAEAEADRINEQLGWNSGSLGSL